MVSVREFLSAVLPSHGFRFLFLHMPDGRPVQRDFSAGDLDDMLGFAQWGVGKQANVYFAVAGYLPPVGGGDLRRTQGCARVHRSLRLDVDCGPGKPYPSKVEGFRALQQFCTSAQLPTPWIVDSGGGLHVYWAFDSDLPVHEWQPLAERLKTLCQQLQFHVDHTVTTDAARVLRLPDTANFKTGTARPVRIVHAAAACGVGAFAARLPAASSLPGLALSGAVPVALRQSLPTELSAGRFEPYFLRGILTQCPGTRAMVADAGASASEPVWKLVLDLINKSDDPAPVKEKVARGLSVGHPGFTEAEFSRKWAQTQQQDYHPPTCDKLYGAGMPQCAACPLRGSIRTPVALGRPQLPVLDSTPAIAVPPPTPAPPVPPHVVPQGVFLLDGSARVRITDGMINKALAIKNGIPAVRLEVQQADGTMAEFWRPIGSYQLVEVERLLDAHGRQSITAITFDRYSDGKARIEATNADLSEARMFNKLLIANGIHMSSNDAKALQDKFMPEFLAQLQRVRAANQIASRCGWTDNNESFVLGTNIYTRDGKVQAVRPASAPEEMEAYHESGDEAAWRRAFDITLAGGPDRQSVLALSIAAPLMVFTGVDGVMLNAYSPESGVGKSTLCDAALSIWGSPNKLRKDYRDTANATFKLAAVVGNLPMVVDEFTNVDGKALSDYVYTITQGREKHRLTTDARLHTNANRWCLPTIVTANNSVHGKLQDYRADAVAEAARVFELRLHPLTVDPAVMGQRKLELLALRNSFGFLGPRLVQLYLSKPAEYWQRLVTDRIAWWDREVSQDTADRFRSACAALVEIGAAIGKSLGFDFDVAGVKVTMREQWQKQQIEFDIARWKPDEFLRQYFTDYGGQFAYIGGQNGEVWVSSVPHRLMGEVRGRSGSGSSFQAHAIIIPLNPLREYVKTKNGNFKTLLEWMQLEERRADGVVEKLGLQTFLAGQIQQVRTPCVRLRPELLGSLAPLRVATAPTEAPPPAPTRIDSRR